MGVRFNLGRLIGVQAEGPFKEEVDIFSFFCLRQVDLIGSNILFKDTPSFFFFFFSFG